jgi:FixJ family two-component response regulator
MTGTIHIVDDDDEVRDSLHALLESYGFRVVTYSDGSDFTRRYRTDMRGCLLLDLDMPGISGLDVLRYLRRDVGSGLPVVLMTGGARGSTREHLLAEGATAYLEKPFDSEAIIDLIKAVL